MPLDQTTPILADVAGMLRSVLGDFGDDAEITMDTTFRDDLGMESIDVVSLAGRLQARYGNSENFALFFREPSLLLGLTNTLIFGVLTSAAVVVGSMSVGWMRIAAVNHLRNPDVLRVGQRLRLPA